MSESNVIAIPGRTVSASVRAPQPALIAILEDWLEMAKTGELQGLELVGIRSVGEQFAITTQWESGNASHEFMLAGASGLEARVKAAWLKQNCPDG